MLRYLLLIPAFAYCAFGQTYTINTVAGGGLPVKIAGVSASLPPVNAVAVDIHGNVYMTLPEYNMVVRLTAGTGQLVALAGNGTAGYTGDSGPATSAQLNNPTSIAVNPDGDVVFVSDSGNAVIRKIAGGSITTVVGTGSIGFSGDNGPATSAQLAPVPGAVNGMGIALDGAGNLYIADTGNYRLRVVANGMINTIVGTGSYGFGGDGADATKAQLASPVGVAVDVYGDVFIADGNRVREVSAGVIATVAGTTTAGAAGDNGLAVKAQLNGPSGIAVDVYGDLFIADTGNSRIRKVVNGVISNLAGNGVPGYSGDNGLPTNAELNLPSGVAVDSGGDLFIADFANRRLRVVDGTIIVTAAGGGSLVGDKGVATNAQLSNPQGLAVDAAGDVFIADFGNSRIREVVNSNITTVAGTGIDGFTGDGASATLAQLYQPAGVALDANGNLYIADSGNNRIRKVSHGVVTEFAGTGTPGFAGDNGPATSAQLKEPFGVAVDSLGNVYIADYSNNRVRKVSNGIITTVAGNGTPGFSGDGGLATSAELSGPRAVAVDSAGNLYIADSLNHCVRLVSGGAITTVAGGGIFNWFGAYRTATTAMLGTTTGVAVDSAGNLYLSDFETNDVDLVSGGLITVIAGDGTPGYSGDGGSSLAAQLENPTGLTLDASNNVFVADAGNQRIRELFLSSSGCTYSVSPSSFASVTAAGGTLVASIQAPTYCHWAVQNLPSWIAFSGNASGAGPATLTFTAAADSDVARTGILYIAGVPVVVTQAGTIVTPPPPVPSITSGGVVNDGNYAAPIAPGSIAAAFGSFLLTSGVIETSPQWPTTLSGLTLEFGGTTPAPLYYVAGTQVDFQVPWELAGLTQTTLTATLNSQTSTAQTVTLAPFAPSIFTMNAQGTGQGAILNSSYVLVDSTNPATAGTTYILIYCTGLGPVSNQPATGSPAPASGIPLSWTTTTPVVTIGGVAATVVFSGLAPGYTGLYQVNALVPATSATGNAVPVTISWNGIASNTATIAVH
jgi:uncharacterized protein (TIGR03437 family)